MKARKPIFRFKARVIDYDPAGYYMTRWDRAKNVSVVASTREEAYEKIWEMMGKAPAGRSWTAFMDSADEEAEWIGPEVEES